MLKRVAGAVIAICSLVAISSASHAETLEQVIEGARKEGALLWYESLTRDEGEAILKDFQKAYPFVRKAEYLDVPGAQKTARITQEILAGGTTSDVFFNGASILQKFVDDGHGLPVDWKTLGVTVSELNTPSPYLISTASIVMGIIYNTNRVSAAEAPKTWDDVASERWRNRTAALSRGIAFAHLAPQMGEERMKDFVRKFGALKPKLSNNGYAIVQWVASGEIDMAVAFHHSAVTTIAKGAPMRFELLDPTPVSQLYGMALKQGKNPNTAKLFLAWFGSKDGAISHEKASLRGNINVPETEIAKMLKSHKISVHTAAEELANSQKLVMMDQELSRYLAGR
jgi:iron(III) transport system substrate-binding protein